MVFRIVLLAGLMSGAVVTAAAEQAAPAPDGAAIFGRSCAMCHGPDGRAATPVAKRMGVRDLASADLTDERVRAAVLDGIKAPKGAMPAFRGRLSEAELDALVAHVRSLRPTENAAK